MTRVLDALFSRAFIAADWESGMDVALANPELIIVTRDGDRFASSGWRIASGRAVVTRATVEESQAVRRARGDRTPSGRFASVARAPTPAAIDARQLLNRATSREAQAHAEHERLEGEERRLAALIDQLSAAEETLREDLAELTEQIVTIDAELFNLRRATAGTRRGRRPSFGEREARVTEARQGLEQVLRTARERRSDRALASRGHVSSPNDADSSSSAAAEIEQRLEGRSSERAEAAGRRESLEFDLQVLDRLSMVVERSSDEIRVAQEAMDSTYREQLEATRAGAERLEEVRRQRKEAESKLAELSDAVRHSEIEQAELVVKIANLNELIRHDLGIEPGELGEVAHPALPEGVTLEGRVAELEARITSLGPINPLALDELSSLEERYKDLDAQVSDVRHARREIQEVIRALDQEIMETFSSAVADVNEHFSALIAMLFPGGQGRLILTEPDDPLNTGVEIEVRPLGRNVRRLSLLSGGERSMAALAFLFAVFRSRPSPFYMMDEVEAALDDVNLQRFLSLVDEFRHEAQLLIVTHQKRTMEAADALYGVTMGPGASSKVISQRAQRAREVESA